MTANISRFFVDINKEVLKLAKALLKNNGTISVPFLQMKLRVTAHEANAIIKLLFKENPRLFKKFSEFRFLCNE